MVHLLKNVVDQRGRLILATSKPTVFAEKILKHFHIDIFFDFVAGSDLDLSRYGKGEVIEYALKNRNIDSENAIMIGDRQHDIIGAKENHLSSIGVLYGYGGRQELVNAHADYIVHNVFELEKLMLAMCANK